MNCRGEQSILISAFIVALGTALLFFISLPVLATPKQHNVYCPFFKENTCYNTLREAEEAIRTGQYAPHPADKYHEKIYEEPLADGTVKYHYSIPNQAPERLYNIGYSGGVSTPFPGPGRVYCASANPEIGDPACADEAELISGTIGYFVGSVVPPCVASNFQVLGGYASPFWDMQSSQLTDIGYIYYREPANQRKITYEVDCPGLHEDREILIDKN